MTKGQKNQECKRLKVSNDAMKNALVLILTTLGEYSEAEVKSICAEALEDAYSPDMFDPNGTPSNDLMVRVIRERDYWRESPNKAHKDCGAADIYFQLIDELSVPPGGSLVDTIDKLVSYNQRLTKKLERALRQRGGYRDKYITLLKSNGLAVNPETDKT